MFNSKIIEVPPVWEMDPVLLIIVVASVFLMILTTFFLVRKELENEKNK